MAPELVGRVLEQLEGVRRNGAGWHARCPAHDDGRASLTVGTGRDGRVLLQCHTGCRVQAIVGALGLEMRDLHPPAEATGRRGLGDEAATYRYTDEAGAVLFEVVRFAPKDFRQRRPDGSWSVKGVRTVPYRLPKVLEAAQAGRVVFVVEGEKDVHRLEKEGLVATCNAGGASKSPDPDRCKWKAEHSEPLRGARVVILPDNDEPGRVHARQVATKLQGIAAEVKLIELPNLSPKADVSDWLGAGGTVEELQELVRRAPPWKGEMPEAAGEEERMPRAACALTAPPPAPLSWRIKRLMTRADSALIVSDGGVGKTSIAIAICGAVADGSPIFANERFTTEACPTLYISEEDPAAVLLNRMEALIDGHGWDRERVLGNFHYFAQEGVSLDDPRWRKHLLEEAARLGVGLVVFDPYADLTTAKENDNDAVKPLLRFFRQLAATTGATPLILHHAGKVVEGKRKIDRIRGASALNAFSRCTYFLEPIEGGIGVECLKLSRAERPAPFVISREVATDAANPAIWRSARLAFLTQREATDDQAEAFIREHLSRGARLNTSELKEIAKGTGISAADVSGALKRLESYRVIDFEPGPKGSKMWGLCLPNTPGNQEQGRLPSLPEIAGQPGETAAVVAPMYRTGNHGKQAPRSRQAERETDELEEALT